jgi:hypothetical protein
MLNFQPIHAFPGMPILATSIRKPIVETPKTYVPPNGHKVKVGPTDSWKSLAAGAGVAPWDLIRYNYPNLPADLQEAAREVNWYLQEYVGCFNLTPDRRNYVFAGANPGEVWIPNSPSAVPLTRDQIARNIILSVLREPVVSLMDFGVGRLFVPATQYEWVAKAIERNFITVREVAGLSGSALYYWGANRIDVPAYSSRPSIGERALIIHECTHAIVDLRKITTVVHETEGLAYVAQALYSNLQGSTHRHVVSEDPHDPLSWASWQMIFDESKRLANIVKRQRVVTEIEASTLYFAINNANFYRSRVGTNEVNDGVADEFYLGE